MSKTRLSFAFRDIQGLSHASTVLHDGPILIGACRFDADSATAELPVWVHSESLGSGHESHALRRSSFYRASLVLEHAQALEVHEHAPIAKPLIDRLEYDEQQQRLRVVCCEPVLLEVKVGRLSGELIIYDEERRDVADVWTIG